MSTRRIHPLDLSVSSSRLMTVIGPIDLPSIDRIRTTLATLVFHDKARLGLTPATGLWWHRHGFDPGVVTARTVDGPVDPGKLATELIREDDLPPARVVIVNGQWIFLDYCHAFSDGVLAVLLTYWLASADGMTPAPELIAGPQPRIPLTRAGIRLVGNGTTGPRRLSAARKRSCPPVPAPTSGTEWSPRPAVMVTATSDADWTQLRALRASQSGDISMAAIIKALCVRALMHAGIDVDPRVQLTFDLRRYLKPQLYSGYLVSTLTFPMTDPANPAEYYQITQAAVTSGHPIAQAAFTSTKITAGLLAAAARRETPEPQPIRFASDPKNPAALTFSDIGPIPLLDEITFSPAPGVGINANVPALPQGINVSYFIFGGRLRVTMTFHDNVTNRDAISRALDLIATDSPSLAAEVLATSKVLAC